LLESCPAAAVTGLPVRMSDANAARRRPPSARCRQRAFSEKAYRLFLACRPSTDERARFSKRSRNMVDFDFS